MRRARKRVKSDVIRAYLLSEIKAGRSDPAGQVVAKYGISRQAANSHLRALIAAGSVSAWGATRARKYAIARTSITRVFELSGLSEDLVWREFVSPNLLKTRPSVKRIVQTGVTEIVNNAIDHSEGQSVRVHVQQTTYGIDVFVADNGVGIFRKIRQALNLEDEQLGALELTKGKFTTDPANHSGEGIFFVSRMFDAFEILSHGLLFAHFPENDDWVVETGKEVSGTVVRMGIARESARTVQQVYDRFAAPDNNFRFSVTHVPVALARVGAENLVSRSQARRLLSRLDRFTRVVLDFAGLDAIGQAFADEVFRVFPRQFPDTVITWVNALPEVEKMIVRVSSGDTQSGAGQRDLFSEGH